MNTMQVIKLELPPCIGPLSSYTPTNDDCLPHPNVPTFYSVSLDLTLLKREGPHEYFDRKSAFYWQKLIVTQNAASRNFAIEVLDIQPSTMDYIKRHCRCSYHTTSRCLRLLCFAPCPDCVGCLQSDCHLRKEILYDTVTFLRQSNTKKQ